MLLYDRANAMLADKRTRPLHASAGALLALVHWTRRENREKSEKEAELGAALKAADAAVALDPRHHHAQAAKGAVLLDMEQPERVLTEGLEPALAANGHNCFVLMKRAEALEALNRVDEVRPAWRDLLTWSNERTGDRCPAWIRSIAEEKLA